MQSHTEPSLNMKFSANTPAKMLSDSRVTLKLKKKVKIVGKPFSKSLTNHFLSRLIKARKKI